MQVLIVYCHPLETSYCHAIYQTVVKALTTTGHELRCIDLYAENFQPVLTAQERADYFDKDRNQQNIQNVKKYIDDIRWAQAIVFVYPTWWFGLPAILKGWLDRVWLPEVTFTVSGDPKKPLNPKLQNVKLMAAVTTYGSPWWIAKWSGEPGRKTLFKGLKPLCHPSCKTLWLALYKMDIVTLTERSRFLTRVEKVFSRL